MKIIDKYLFSNPTDFKALEKTLLGKKLSGTSGVIEDYENKLSTFFNSKYAIAVSSGSAAIQTALFALDIGQGDDVIVSSTCPSMTIFPIIYAGANPIFCDTYCDGFGLSIQDLGKVISHKTKAIIEVPMWGYPTNVKELYEFSSSKNIPLLLDLAQAHCTKMNDSYLSHYGDISCFSTHDRKILATGEGGFILTNNENYKIKTKKFIQFGNMNGVDFGLNYKLGSLQAALGINRIDYIQKQLEVRKSNANYILSKIKSSQVKEFEIIENGNPNYYFLLLKLEFSDNLKFINFLNDSGIPSDVLRYNYKVLYEYPIFNKFKKVCVNSAKLAQSITTIPVHPGIGKNKLDYIINKINEFEYV